MQAKKLFFINLFILFSFHSFAESFQAAFPKQFYKAMVLKDTYVTELKNQNIKDTAFYISIVFPELMRYTEKRDKLETILNSITYITISNYEGFSIGAFQIKPNFIKQLEDYISADSKLKEKYSDLLIEGNLSDFSTKYERIIRLQNDTYLVKYLIAFVEISLTKYNLNLLPKNEQLKYLATIYNTGFKERFDDYTLFLTTKAFPFGLNSEKSKWNYSDLVLEFYSILSKNN